MQWHPLLCAMAYHIADLILITPVELVPAGDNVHSVVISSNNIPLNCLTTSHEGGS